MSVSCVFRAGAALFVLPAAAAALSAAAFAFAASARADGAMVTCAISGSFTDTPGVTTTPGTDAARGSGASISCLGWGGGRGGRGPRAARVSTTGTLSGTCSSIGGTLKTTITWSMPDGSRRTSVLAWTLDPGSSMIAATGHGVIEPGGYLGRHRATVSISDPGGNALDCAEGNGDTGQSDQGILSIL